MTAAKYIASCSFGKDSMATILLALEHGEPLDEVVYCEVMFDAETSGEIPEHRDFIYNVPIAAGVEVLAHELAHVATPEDHTHGDAWRAAFDRIFEEYNRIVQELFGEAFTNDEE